MDGISNLQPELTNKRHNFTNMHDTIIIENEKRKRNSSHKLIRTHHHSVLGALKTYSLVVNKPHLKSLESMSTTRQHTNTRTHARI